jgi:hypothetical protein
MPAPLSATETIIQYSPHSVALTAVSALSHCRRQGLPQNTHSFRSSVVSMNSGFTERRHRAHLGGRRVVSRTLLGLAAVTPVRGPPMSLGLSARGPATGNVSSLAASRSEAVTISISIIVVGCAVVAVVHLLIMECERGSEAVSAYPF